MLTIGGAKGSTVKRVQSLLPDADRLQAVGAGRRRQRASTLSSSGFSVAGNLRRSRVGRKEVTTHLPPQPNEGSQSVRAVVTQLALRRGAGLPAVPSCVAGSGPAGPAQLSSPHP